MIGLRFRNGQPQYDETLKTVLAERPTRVIVVSDPELEAGSQRHRTLVPAG